jgi:hypothetical protein
MLVNIYVLGLILKKKNYLYKIPKKTGINQFQSVHIDLSFSGL